ncbi:MAG: response regulator [Elusimicrobia bacterium]|nr:response regulator [Elusimicrobiota bacterium]
MNKQKKILIVEDERNLSQIYKSELEEAGYSVYIANTGFSAIDYVKTTKPDLVILDVKLPDINGIKVLQRIKQQYNDLSVVMCTAYEQFEDYYKRFTDNNTKFYSYLTKPVSLEALREEVKRAIGGPTT